MARQRMAPVDAAWLHMDRPVNELIVHAVLWFEGELSDELVREAIESRLVARHPRFAQRVEDTGTKAWWVDQPDFDAMTHVTRERLAGPGELTELTEHVTRIASQRLPRDAPLWQIHIIDGYRGGTALVARIHHCIADGVALFRVLLALSDEAQEHRDYQPPPSPDRPAQDGVRRAGELARGTGKVTRALLELVCLPADKTTTLRSPLGGTKTLQWSEPMPLDAVKSAARAAGATINDLVLAALTGALGRYLDDTDGRSRDIRAVLPVNLRRHKHTEQPLGNRFGLVFLRLPISTGTGHLRVAAIRTRTAKLKTSATAVVALHILRVAGRMPTRVVQVLIGLFSAKASIVVTNVPGPRQALHLGGHRLNGIIAWPPQSGTIGLGVAVISYAGQIIVGVTADTKTLPDPQRLLTDMRAELGMLGVPLPTASTGQPTSSDIE